MVRAESGIGSAGRAPGGRCVGSQFLVFELDFYVRHADTPLLALCGLVAPLGLAVGRRRSGGTGVSPAQAT